MGALRVRGSWTLEKVQAAFFSCTLICFLHGRHIVLVKQGYGSFILFARYLKLMEIVRSQHP